MKSTLIVDSSFFGASWCFFDSLGNGHTFRTDPIVPGKQSDRDMQKIMSQLEISPYEFELLSEVYYYGTGCYNPDRREYVCSALSGYFNQAYVEVSTELLGLARAAFGNDKGVIVMLDSGSAMAFYDGEQLIRNRFTVGHILGDEASVVHVGKRLIVDYLYGLMPDGLSQAFLDEYEVTKEQIIQNIYQKKTSHRFLASFLPFVKKFRSHPYIAKLLGGLCEDFLTNLVKLIPEVYSYPCCFSGVLAEIVQSELVSACANSNITSVRVEPRNIDGIIAYHDPCFIQHVV